MSHRFGSYLSYFTCLSMRDCPHTHTHTYKYDADTFNLLSKIYADLGHCNSILEHKCNTMYFLLGSWIFRVCSEELVSESLDFEVAPEQIAFHFGLN
jgi:hypothetical protein